MPARIEAVLFDVDDTLVDHEGAARLGLERYLRATGRPFDDAVWASWLVVEHRHFDRYLAGELTFAEQRMARARGFTGLELSDAAAEAWFDGYRLCFEAAWAVFDDVRPVLDELAAAGLPLGAYSNVEAAYTRRKLAAVDLLDRFAVVLGRDDVPSGKPAPDPFLALTAALGIAPALALHVGDRYEVDARPARDAGLVGVWLHRPGTDLTHRGPRAPLDPQVAVIASLAELPALVAANRW